MRLRRRPRSPRRRERGRPGFATWLAALVALAGLPAVAGVVWLASPAAAPDPAAELVRELAGAGEEADVIECVRRLAADDLRVGPIDTPAVAELLAGCRAARRALAFAAEEEPAAPLGAGDEPATLGDDQRLDELWVACEEGSGSACDRLFAEAPVGSGYETYGLTCGDRPELLHCTELDTDDTDGAADTDDGGPGESTAPGT